MNISKEIIKNGNVTIYSDSDLKIVNEITEYNKFMWDCRVKMKRLVEIKFAHIILNPLIIFVLMFGQANKIIQSPLTPILILAVYIIIFVKFVLFDQALLFSTITVSLFLYLDFRFIFLFVTDVLLFLMHYGLERRLKPHLSYPTFNDINIRYERGECPKNH